MPSGRLGSAIFSINNKLDYKNVSLFADVHQQNTVLFSD